MILLLDTSTPMCRLTLIEAEQRYDYEWTANRELAKGLLAYLRQKLATHGANLTSLEGIGVFQGPGSFTGLRIGMTVLNTVADAGNIPIIGVTGDLWIEDAITALHEGKNHTIVLPVYGREANITTPRK